MRFESWNVSKERRTSTVAKIHRKYGETFVEVRFRLVFDFVYFQRIFGVFSGDQTGECPCAGTGSIGSDSLHTSDSIVRR